jgi:hypothetical protein
MPPSKRGSYGITQSRWFWPIQILLGLIILAVLSGYPLRHFTTIPDYEFEAGLVRQMLALEDTQQGFADTATQQHMACTSAPRGPAVVVTCSASPKRIVHDMLDFLDPPPKVIIAIGTFLDGHKSGNYSLKIVDEAGAKAKP